jgi:hypothetical protein
VKYGDKEGLAAAVTRLEQVFPYAGIHYAWFDHPTALIDVCTDEDNPIVFKFSDMAKIAAALGTERLDFQHHNGDHLIDSYSFNGCNVLRIWASYP